MDAISKKRAELFEEARRIALLCDAEVALLIISAEGERHEFVSSNSSVEEIVTRFKEFNAEGTGEHVPKKIINAAKLKSRELLGKDLAEMSSGELTELERKISLGLLFILNRETQLMTEALQQLRMATKRLLMQSQLFEKQLQIK